jgi:hypothetical protein
MLPQRLQHLVEQEVAQNQRGHLNRVMDLLNNAHLPWNFLFPLAQPTVVTPAVPAQAKATPVALALEHLENRAQVRKSLKKSPEKKSAPRVVTRARAQAMAGIAKSQGDRSQTRSMRLVEENRLGVAQVVVFPKPQLGMPPSAAPSKANQNRKATGHLNIEIPPQPVATRPLSSLIGKRKMKLGSAGFYDPSGKKKAGKGTSTCYFFP